ncbi:MAG TPA: rod shape-determining protein [Bacteroidales bacterium]|nr:rod shape-determining protein [Bacteroidales bacterium]
MGLFNFTQEIAIDLGTANTIIISNDKVLIDEPSYIALDARTNKVMAVGKKAKMMDERGDVSKVRVVRPLREGVIADFEACELMMREMIHMLPNKSHFFNNSLKMVVCIPSGSTEVEKRAVQDSSERSGGRNVFMIYEPMAAALGIGIDVEAPSGSMIVDIGGGTSEIAVISLGSIVTNKSIKTAGDDFNEDIVEHMARMHNMRIGSPTAERIKVAVGAALTELDDAPEDFIVRGPNRMTALPMEVPVSYQEIAHCLEKSITKIENAVLTALENTPAELYSDIVDRGIFLTGGGALLRGLDKRLTNKINIQFHVAEAPLLAVARGTGIALKNAEKYSFLMRS